METIERINRNIKEAVAAINSCMPTAMEAAENIRKNLKLLGEVNSMAEPQLIQGYTAENWKEIIDGGYLCEFGDTEIYFATGLQKLNAFNISQEDGFIFSREDGGYRKFCRPAQIKGVMRPIFVEPVDKKNTWFIFFDDENKMVSQGTRHHPGENQDSFEKLFEETCKRMDITKYIEL